MSYLPQVCYRRRPGVRSKTRERERERERGRGRERGSDRGRDEGREALEKLLSPPMFYLPVVCLCGRSGEGLGMEATEDQDRGIGSVEFGLNLFRCVLLTYKFRW